MTLIILGIIGVGLICFFAGRQSGVDKAYWRGRGEGWKACEDMVIKRMVEAGYKEEKIWEDLIQ